ncbi:MAG: MATE family efflux transporter [Legionellales bacterium]|jgi:MATE family multidrug resistance protein
MKADDKSSESSLEIVTVPATTTNTGRILTEEDKLLLAATQQVILNNPQGLSEEEQLSLLKAMEKILSLGVPTVLSYTYSLFMVALGIMGGRLGNKDDEETYLGATILASTTLHTVLLLSLSPFFALAPQVKSLQGLEQHAQVSASLKHAVMLSVPVGFIATLPLLFSKQMLTAFGQNNDNVELAATFLKPASLVMPPVMLRICFEQMLFAFDKQADVMKMALTSFAIGLPITYMLGFGKWGAPKLEFEGLAYGLVIQEYLIIMLFGLYLHKHPDLSSRKFFKAFQSLTQDDFKQIKSLLKAGIPISLTILSEVGASFAMAVGAGLQGKDAQAAYNVAAQFTFFTATAPIAFGQTTMQQVSGSIANNQLTNARQLAIAGVASSVLLISPICLAIIIDPSLLEKIFTNNAEDLDNDVHDMIQKLAPVVAIGAVLDAIRFNLLQVLRVTEDGNKATLIVNLSLWAGVGLAYSLGNLTSLELLGMVASYELFGIGMGAAALVPRWRTRIKVSHLENVYRNLRNESSDTNSSIDNGRSTPLPEYINTSSSSHSVNSDINLDSTDSTTSTSEITAPGKKEYRCVLL